MSRTSTGILQVHKHNSFLGIDTTLLLADLTQSIKNKIYLSIWRPITLYGHELYHSGINIDYIERYERYWLRVSQRRWKEDRRTLYADIQFPPISQYIKDSQKRYIISNSNKKFANLNLPEQLNIIIKGHKISYHELLQMINQ